MTALRQSSTNHSSKEENMIDLNNVEAELTRYDTLETGVESLLAAQAQSNKDAVAKAIADTQAADKATLDQITVAAQAAIDTDAARFKNRNDSLAAAIVANTPAAPPSS